jgi:RHS repeat-associated protein
VIGRQIVSGTGVNQINTSYSYTARNQISSIKHTSSVAGTLATYTYIYDAAQRLTTYSWSGGTVTFGYDPTNQLTSASGARTESYGYDKNGNRNTGSYVTTFGNRTTYDGTTTYVYDNEGNVVEKQAGGVTTTFTWDYRNRLTEVLVMSGTSTVADDKFTYDMFNRRIGKLTNGGTQSWTVYDGVNPYADFSGSTLQYRYLYGNAVDQLFARFDGTTGNDSTIWYLTDNLGSIRQMVKTDGTIVDTVTYGDSYGKSPTDSPTGSGDRFKFAGMQYDSEIGIYYDRARYYDPGVGRFLSHDPNGFYAGDANLYRYVANSPTFFTDPTGLEIPGVPRRPKIFWEPGDPISASNPPFFPPPSTPVYTLPPSSWAPPKTILPYLTPPASALEEIMNFLNPILGCGSMRIGPGTFILDIGQQPNFGGGPPRGPGGGVTDSPDNGYQNPKPQTIFGYPVPFPIQLQYVIPPPPESQNQSGVPR